MNPSSSGWIQKFTKEFSKETLLKNHNNNQKLYQDLKKVGFIYGASANSILNNLATDFKLTLQEFTKINLFQALVLTYFYKYPLLSYDSAINSILLFYDDMGKGKPDFFQKLTFTKNPSANLEAVLSSRINENTSPIKSDWSPLFATAQLYSDVLAFHYFLCKTKPKEFYENIWDKIVLYYIKNTLESKREKNKYDVLVLEMIKSKVEHNLLNYTQYLSKLSLIEKDYLLALCCLTVWEDKKTDVQEIKFLEKTFVEFGFTINDLETSLQQLRDFSIKNEKNLQLFEYTHPVKNIYKQSSETVKLLILRNKKRLTQELSESGELVLLLGQSTLRELNNGEKQKVKTQLLDICKTIPSLTIFLLPGGTLLLPLLVKFIPKLLPSSFQDNQIKD